MSDAALQSAAVQAPGRNKGVALGLLTGGTIGPLKVVNEYTIGGSRLKVLGAHAAELDKARKICG